jgi:L-histidine N-alpha-methyltransferase
MSSPTDRVTVEVHLEPGALRRALREDVRRGLTSTPKELPPKWFYDDRGSALFDEITRLPEYYPTRRERKILEREAATIAAASGADTIVELGSGTSEKTRLLLDAFEASDQLRRFVPFDVNEAFLTAACEQIATEHPGIDVHGVVGDFEQHLPLLPRGGRRMVAFLGSTIGNLDADGRKSFFAGLVSGLAPGDCLLLGTDLVKDVARLEAAYDDAAGVTAEFNRNVLRVINRELGANFAVDAFDHVAFFDERYERIEMWLRAARAQRVAITELDLQVDVAAGEAIRTEISCKFHRDVVEDELAAAGLELRHWWTDTGGDFALSLSFL